MFNLIVKEDIVLERKSFWPVGPVGISFPEFLSNQGLDELSAFSAIELYRTAMPLFDAVDRRAMAFSQIPIKVFNTKEKEFESDHPALELLKAPNADLSQGEFLETLASYYDITGDAFLIATGNVTKPPLELINYSPVDVSFGALSDKFGLLNVPASIFLIKATGDPQGTFNPIETPESKGIRFFNQVDDKELWHIRTFNPLRTGGRFRGMSRARPIWFELQQYISGNISNLSFLKRGARPSMAWVNKTAGAEGELTPLQFERLKQEALKYTGDHNAGGTPILDGIEIQTFQSTNKDMEHKEMQNQMLARTFNTYRIPIALVLEATMTLNNLETAMLHFFDDAVIPLANRIYSELTRFIMPRYPNSENLIFTFSESDIPALRARMVAAAKEQNSIGVNTTNEIREMLGDEELEEGGDTILVPANLIPLGVGFEDEETTATTQNADEEQEEGAAANEVDEEERAIEFFRVMKSRTDEEGEPLYTDPEIIKLAIEGGLFNVA